MKEKEIAKLGETIQSMLVDAFDYSARTSKAVISCGDRYVYAFLEEKGECLDIDVGGNASGMELNNLCRAIKAEIDTFAVLCEVWRIECTDSSYYNDYEL